MCPTQIILFTGPEMQQFHVKWTDVPPLDELNFLQLDTSSSSGDGEQGTFHSSFNNN